MARKTWTISHGIKVKALKSEAKALNRMLSKVEKIENYVRETNGIVGGESTNCILWSPFTIQGEPRNTEFYREKFFAWVEGMGDHTIEIEELKTLIGVGNAIFSDHVPERDKRRTLKDVEENNARYEETKKRQLEGADAFISEWSSGEEITIPQGNMALGIAVTFDDSDIMTDYFSPFAGIGLEMLLGIAPMGRHSESAARKIIERFPELCKLEWAWHKENYSMGRGYYLCSEFFDVEDSNRQHYRGGKVEQVRFFVQFNKYNEGKSMPAFRGYTR